ncbi:MAG TPA: tetratricopeptide repeat protein, partial [Anaerolineales bacterium]|nr:tetratricopeptide repeat protein [Anaerolineales bacterium]
MNFTSDYETTLDGLLRDARAYLAAGQKEEAREVLRQALALDRDNLETWELLWKAAYTTNEELSSVRHILRLDPKHAAAKKRLSALRRLGATKTDSQPRSRTAVRRQRRKQSTVLLLLLGTFVSVFCVSVTGLALYRSGYLSIGSAPNLSATALAEKNASCQALIDRTIQASENFCDETSSNTTCYGNNSLTAELAPNVNRRFSARGDIIAVSELRRLAASPLNLERDEWGIAVFKLIANLPRSLPGETVTMVVFGNSTLDNQSGTSDSLESFYFSSELGQIVCEKVPFDGLMISSPDGSGIRLSINGAELTLMGTASIKAVKNGQMEVNLYRGSARVVANGQEQYFGAGQQVSVQLGGENGTESIGTPSQPEPLSPGELTVACTMTGQYCSPAEVAPVSAEQAQAEIQNAITSTPTPVAITHTPSPTVPPTYTLVVLPQTLFPRTPTHTPTSTLTPSRTPTRTPRPTNTRTNTPPPTFTFTATITPIAPPEADCAPLVSSVLTQITSSQLGMDIANNSGSTIAIDRIMAYWPDIPTHQQINQILLNGAVIWNPADPNSPSDIPKEGNWTNTADLTIPNATTGNLVVQFSNDLQPTGYKVHVVFDIGCQVTA